MARYQPPDVLTKAVFNPLVMLATKLGMSLRGSNVLYVTRRKSGGTQSVPVNPLALDGGRYLVAPRGNTQWVRNLRAAGGGELRVGRKRERFTAQELPDDQKVPLLRAYLANWKSETGKFFGGVDDKAPDEELRRIAPDHPVFRIVDKR